MLARNHRRSPPFCPTTLIHLLTHSHVQRSFDESNLGNVGFSRHWGEIMETLLEQQRRLHEERERLESSMAEEMLHKKQSVNYESYN